MGCCLFAIILAGAPRFAFLMLWLFQPLRVTTTFDTFIWPALGVLFAPWTALAYVLVFPGGISGFDWIWLGLAVAIDLGTYVGNGESGRRYRSR